MPLLGGCKCVCVRFWKPLPWLEGSELDMILGNGFEGRFGGNGGRRQRRRGARTKDERIGRTRDSRVRCAVRASQVCAAVCAAESSSKPEGLCWRAERTRWQSLGAMNRESTRGWQASLEGSVAAWCGIDAASGTAQAEGLQRAHAGSRTGMKGEWGVWW